MTRSTLDMLALAAGMFAVAPWIINAAPYEATMGLVYKIYFFHMPSAWMFLIAAIVAGVASARFLFLKTATRGRLGDGGGRAGGAVRRVHAGDRARSGRARRGACGGCGTRG